MSQKMSERRNQDKFALAPEENTVAKGNKDFLVKTELEGTSFGMHPGNFQLRSLNSVSGIVIKFIKTDVTIRRDPKQMSHNHIIVR